MGQIKGSQLPRISLEGNVLCRKPNTLTWTVDLIRGPMTISQPPQTITEAPLKPPAKSRGSKEGGFEPMEPLTPKAPPRKEFSPQPMW